MGRPQDSNNCRAANHNSWSLKDYLLQWMDNSGIQNGFVYERQNKKNDWSPQCGYVPTLY